MKVLVYAPGHECMVDLKVNDVIGDLHSERTLREVCEVWPGEESELVEALEYLKEYLNDN